MIYVHHNFFKSNFSSMGTWSLPLIGTLISDSTTASMAS